MKRLDPREVVEIRITNHLRVGDDLNRIRATATNNRGVIENSRSGDLDHIRTRPTEKSIAAREGRIAQTRNQRAAERGTRGVDRDFGVRGCVARRTQRVASRSSALECRNSGCQGIGSERDVVACERGGLDDLDAGNPRQLRVGDGSGRRKNERVVASAADNRIGQNLGATGEQEAVAVVAAEERGCARGIRHQSIVARLA